MYNFDFTKDHILEDDMVILRPLTQDDFDNLLPFSLNEPTLWKFSQQDAAGEENLRNYIARTLENKEKKSEYPFIIFDKRTNKYAGSTRFYDIQLQNQSLEIGYTWYGKNFQATGLNKHCKFLLLQFAFEEMKIERVAFRADNNNKRSIAAMKSIGCIEEGILRQNLPMQNGLRRDSIILSILKNEWFGKVKENLKNKLI